MAMKLRLLTVFAILLSFTALPGCGGAPSTEDLIARAAMRKRPESGDDDKKDDDYTPPKKEAEKPDDSIAAKAIDTVKNVVDEASGELKKPADVLATLGQLKIKPLRERVSSKTDDKDVCRKRAVNSLTKIADALAKHHADKGRYPGLFLRANNGVATLSWRVELLPYLGYEQLYKKFDRERPWNREPNKSLLEFIPDEFLSDRFDTKTNFLLPAYTTFVGGGSKGIRGPRNKDIEDGAENTILLVEVNDELAVPWTQPVDYIPEDRSNLKNDLGSVRGDGTFAVWANGWTVLLANSLTNTQIMNALTADAGDGQNAGQVHRDIPVGNPSDASKVAKEDDAQPDTNHPTTTERSGFSPPLVAVQNTRQPLPIAGDIAKAQARLKEIFLKKIVDAKEDDEKSNLASEMLDNAQGMPDDGAGAYALQAAAVRLATAAGELEPVLRATDQRVGRFEVDSYEENINSLLAFAEGTTRREPSELDGESFLRRAVPVIYAGIRDNDFLRVSGLTRHCHRMRKQKADEDIQKDLNRLRTLLSSAQREYDKSSDSLAAYRNDPSAVEDAAAFGRFLCFIKGDWNQGLPLVVLGGPRHLKEVGLRDLQGAKTYKEDVAIGDAWWQLSNEIRNGVYRQSLRDRAAYWYSKAFPVMPESLDRIHVKNRLHELDNNDATSPIALIEKLAGDVGVSLTTSLSAIASTGQRSTRGVRGIQNDWDED